MEGLAIVIGVVVGLAVGAAGFWFAMRGRISDLSARLATSESELKSLTNEHQSALAARAEALTRAERVPELDNRVSTMTTHIADLEKQIERETTRAAEKAEQHRMQIQQLEDLQTQFSETFQNLSNQTMDETRKKFFVQAEEMLKQYRTTANDDMEAKAQAIEKLLDPVHKQLENLDRLSSDIEDKRKLSHGQLTEQLKNLGLQQASLEQETTRLVKALQDPGTAGSWGEMVLERVMEMAGLEERWSYSTQETKATEDGVHRPDVIVRLPAGRTIVIDSKAPMRAYMDGIGTEDQVARGTYMAAHAKKLLDHARVLNKKDYAQHDDTLDFTVMFIPSEAAFRAACEVNHDLIEKAMQDGVFIATPTTLLALLRAIAYGWRQEKLAQEAQQVQVEGRRLYENIATLVAHYESLGKALDSATKHYNNFGGSLEGSVLPAARRFKAAGVSSTKALPKVNEVEFSPRPLTRTKIELAGQLDLLDDTDLTGTDD